MLDVIVGRIERGDEFTLNVYVVEPSCARPDVAAATAYTYGCRCERCRTDARDRRRVQRAARRSVRLGLEG